MPAFSGPRSGLRRRCRCAAEVQVPHAYRQFDPAGQLTDPGLRTALGELLGELAGAAIGLRTVVAGR